MALVDYSSSDSDPDVESGPGCAVESESRAESKAEIYDTTGAAPSAKKRKVSHAKISGSTLSLPPLPSAFHDLYASTVRVSTNDDPTLHQGRKRVNPHRAGNWPTHIYIEWHPTTAQRALLTSLIGKIQSSVSRSTEILSFLSSDLGAPQPLHISLSRPIVLSASQKDEFLEQLIADISKSGVQPFDLIPLALSWHRTAESARSFLVLRVASSSSSSKPESTGSTTTATANTTSSRETTKKAEPPSNPELATLLDRCNRLATKHGQPPLYAPQMLEGGSSSSSRSTALHDAFHVSVAWSFAEVDAELRARTADALAAAAAAAAEPGLRGDGVLGMRVRVDGVKAKIGNVVTHVALPARGKSAYGTHEHSLI